jgi:CBS domain-containing protein
MRTVREILGDKGDTVWTIAAKASVFEALELMEQKDVGVLVVRGGPGEIVGILSERDYARKVILTGKHSRQTLVEEIMTPADKMVVARPENSVEECMALMAQSHIRHLPVFDGRKMAGIISSRDVIKAVLEDKEAKIDTLKSVSKNLFSQLFEERISSGKN